MFKTLRAQIIIMLAVPLIGLIVTSAVSILDKRETSRQFEILLPLAKVSIVASELIHELQKERGKTVGLITSGYTISIGAPSTNSVASPTRGLRISSLSLRTQEFAP